MAGGAWFAGRVSPLSALPKMKNEGDTRQNNYSPNTGVPRLRRWGGKGDFKPDAKRLALVSSRTGSDNVAKTATAKVARRAKTVVNLMVKNERRRAG